MIALIATLAAMLFPVFSQAKKSANGPSCAANLRQIGMTISLYATDNDDRYPRAVDAAEKFGHCAGDDTGHADWPELHKLLQTYARSTALWHCPLDNGIPDPSPTGPSEASECSLPSTHPSTFAVFGDSYSYRSEFSREGVAQPATGHDPNTKEEVGSSQIAICYDLHGGWHGAKESADKRWNTLFADNHVRSLRSLELGQAKNYEPGSAR